MKCRKRKQKLYVVIRDYAADPRDTYRAHRCHTLREGRAFIRGVEYVNDSALDILGMYYASTQQDAIDQAANEHEKSLRELYALDDEL